MVNRVGESLFKYRTRVFYEMQQDFATWRESGHKFRCFTQHENTNPIIDDYSEFDQVIKIPRGNASASRNCVLSHYAPGQWIGVWDNDATVYWNRLNTTQFVKELDTKVIDKATALGLTGFIPFNAQQAPYPQKPLPPYTFKPDFPKGTMMFLQVKDYRFDETITALEENELASRLILQGHKFGKSQDIALKELQSDKSTVFKIKNYYQPYERPGPRANPKGKLAWDAQENRKQQYLAYTEIIEQKLGTSFSNIREQHRTLWQDNDATE